MLTRLQLERDYEEASAVLIVLMIVLLTLNRLLLIPLKERRAPKPNTDFSKPRTDQLESFYRLCLSRTNELCYLVCVVLSKQLRLST